MFLDFVFGCLRLKDLLTGGLGFSLVLPNIGILFDLAEVLSLRLNQDVALFCSGGMWRWKELTAACNQSFSALEVLILDSAPSIAFSTKSQLPRTLAFPQLKTPCSCTAVDPVQSPKNLNLKPWNPKPKTLEP